MSYTRFEPITVLLLSEFHTGSKFGRQLQNNLLSVRHVLAQLTMNDYLLPNSLVLSCGSVFRMTLHQLRH